MTQGVENRLEFGGNADDAPQDPWEVLRDAARRDDLEKKCFTEIEETYKEAFLSFAQSMDTMADKCEEARATGLTKCMGKASGVSMTSLLRRAWRFQSITRKFMGCAWHKEMAQEVRDTNEALGLALSRVYQSAPEFKTIRTSNPGFSLRRFVQGTKDLKATSPEELEAEIFQAMSSGFGTAPSSEISSAMRRAREEDLGPEDIP